MLSSTVSLLQCFFLCPQFIMSHAGSPSSPRSRSPPRETGKKEKAKPSSKGADAPSDNPETWSDQIWDDICPRLDVKLDGFKDDVKKVVNTLVGKQVERLEKKIEHNQQATNTNIKNLEKQMDGKFATMESNLLNAIQAASKATPSPSEPSGTPGPSGIASSVAPSFTVADGIARYDARPGVAMAPCPPWVNDVTTPHFNRAPDATKLFCNIHDRVQVSKSKFREKNVGVGCGVRA